MRARGIATSAIVVIVIVTVVAVGAGVYLFVGRQPEPGGGPGKNQLGGGAEAAGVPVYSGATAFSIQSEIKTGLGIPTDATCEGYTTTASTENVMNWYK